MIPINDGAYQLLHEGALAFERAENFGIKIDVEYCKKQEKLLSRKMIKDETKLEQSEIGRKWKEYKGRIAWSSDNELSTLLFKIMKLEPHKLTDKGNPSLDDESLEALGEKVQGLNLISSLRRNRKLKNTYISGLLREQVDGILRPFFQFNPTTYRSSSSHINFQNIPKRDKIMMQTIRNAIYAHDGFQILAADFGGIEVCTSEFYHHDPTMYKYIIDENSNMHRDLAIQIFMLDQLDKSVDGEKALYNGAKNGFVFPQFYGDYYGNNAASLWKWAGLSSHTIKPDSGVTLSNGTPIGEHLLNKKIRLYEQFERHIKGIEEDFWSNRFKIYAKWKEAWYKSYIDNGYVEMYTGFRSHGVLSKNQVINLPIQGTAFHLLLKSFILVDKKLKKRKMKSRLMGQIHDELLVAVWPPELKTVIKILKRTMQKELPLIWKWINTPLKVEMDLCPVDRPWSEREELPV